MKKLLSNKAYIAVFVAPGLILFLVMAVIPLLPQDITDCSITTESEKKSL